LHGIQIEDILALGIIAKLLVIAGQTQDVMDVKGCGAQNVALQSNSVSVSGNHLQGRFQAHEFEVDAGCQAAKARDRGLIVGYVDGIYMVLDHFCLFGDSLSIAATRGTALRCDGQMTCR
jgi:hypothetical protein